MTQLLPAPSAALSCPGTGAMRPWQWSALMVVAMGAAAAQADEAAPNPPYRVVDGRADSRTYNGYRRYHAGCNHCHGPDGVGSSFGPSLIEAPLDRAAFGDAVLDGRRTGASVMKGFAGDPNVAPFLDDIYAYLQARADGALGRGRPARLNGN